MKILWTDSAKNDLLDIRAYLTEHHGMAFSAKTSRAIREEVESLRSAPNKGSFVAELEELELNNYRQLLAGQHRIIVEKVSDALCYVHVVCYTRRNLESLLRRRLLKP